LLLSLSLPLSPRFNHTGFSFSPSLSPTKSDVKNARTSTVPQHTFVGEVSYTQGDASTYFNI